MQSVRGRFRPSIHPSVRNNFTFWPTRSNLCHIIIPFIRPCLFMRYQSCNPNWLKRNGYNFENPSHELLHSRGLANKSRFLSQQQIHNMDKRTRARTHGCTFTHQCALTYTHTCTYARKNPSSHRCTHAR